MKHLAREKFKQCEFAKDFFFKVIKLNESSLKEVVDKVLHKDLENGKKFYIKPVFGFCGYSSAEISIDTDMVKLDATLRDE